MNENSELLTENLIENDCLHFFWQNVNKHQNNNDIINSCYMYITCYHGHELFEQVLYYQSINCISDYKICRDTLINLFQYATKNLSEINSKTITCGVNCCP